MKELDLGDMFAAGAKSVASEHGMNEKDADFFAGRLRKEALFGRYRSSGDDEETWWDRNKKWIIPTGVGIGAFMIGNDAGKNGRPDQGALSNAWNLLVKRINALLGKSDSAFWDSLTKARKLKDPPEEQNPAGPGEDYPKGEF